MSFFLILIGFILLILGGNWLLKSAVSISLGLKIPKIIIGMTVVSFATSVPELIVSINSAVNGFPDLALGNVIGSNIANLGLVLGITLLIAEMDVQKSFFKTNWPVMMAASILLFLFLRNDYLISDFEGLIFVLFLIFFLVYLFRFQNDEIIDDLPEDVDLLPVYKTFTLFMLGSVGLWGGSEMLITGATDLAITLGVGERLIGVTVVSVGTSIPELAASIIAVLKKEKAISLGNLVGSNIFNILAVVGITSLITPIPANDNIIYTNDIYWMLLVSMVLPILVLLPKKMELKRKSGIILLLLYVVFLYQTIR
ncbi:calcium/sodium antiporter [Flavobacteriaceae bacterium]|nr:calcium/sodium antiporter [Flavobacteriaceae bacterium]